MNNEIRLSIVIPTWNRKKLLLSILNSFNKQSTNKNLYEIIICDSFSDDGTDKTILDFKKENSPINLIHTNIKKIRHKFDKKWIYVLHGVRMCF